MRRIVGAIVFVVIATAFAVPGSVAAGPTEPNIIPRTELPYGVSYVAWTERSLNWVFGATAERSPLAHADRCANYPHLSIETVSNVNFGETVKVHCTISRRTPVLVSPGGGGCDSSLGGPTTAAALKSCAEEGIAGLTNFRVIIDGSEVQDIESFRFETPVFTIRYRPGNIFAVPPGGYRSVGISYMLMLRPLHAGKHTIVVHDESSNGKVAQLTMFLTVV
jgi:hypothetical protein